uniref:protein-tyrosine-phosphatase n=1 Tax=Gasterosteus aculeatus aculeatus TaxID=481459 RepID=G3PAL9_GASAC
MKLALLSSVPLRTLLLVFSAVLGIAQVAEADTTTSTDGNATDSNSGTTTSISISNVTSEGSTVEQTTSVSLFTKPEVVRNITVTNVTTSSISLTWNDPKGNSSSYRVQWTDSVDTTSITITNLTAGVQYKITVAAVTNEGSTEGQNTSVSQYTRPGEIGTPTVSTNTSSISLNWTSPPGEVFKFRLEWSSNGDMRNMCTYDNFAVISELIPGTSYTISVIAIAGDNQTEGRAHRITAVTKPEVVRNITVANVTTSSISLKWIEPKGNSSFYRVQWTDGNVTHNNSVNTTSITITNLTAGVQYKITVAAVTNEGSTEGQNTSVSQYTRPGEIGTPTVSTNTSSISLNWTSPPGEVFKFRLEWSSNGAIRNMCTYDNFAVISELIPGTSYTISVIAVAGDNQTEGRAHRVTAVTRPAAVSGVTAIGNTTAMTVSWKEAVGLVGSYAVLLFRDNLMVKNVTDLSNFTTNVGFTDLIPGVLYCVEVVTTSGPLMNAASRVCNATFPNPPGPIMVESQTVNSINFTWPFPGGMDYTQYNFSVSSHNGSSVISKNWYVLQNLESGSPYNLSVVTVGVLHYESTAVTTFKYTRPLSVNNLTTSTEEDSITVMWEKPDQYKESYCYILSWHSSDESIRNTPITRFYSKINDLVPGKQYNISVTTETVDGTEGAPIWISVCTNAGAVKDLICDGPDTTIAQVILSWKKNNGQNSGFKVTVNNGETVNYTHSCCNYTVSNLRHNTSYNLSVETQSCGLPSRPETRLCWTGITNPPIPKNYQDLVVVTNKEYNKFSLQIKRGLLDSINGPITHVGVLVTQTDPGASDLTTYVSKTYQEWKEQATQVYMATVKNLTETTVTSRSEEGPLDIEIGSENKWGAYFNGPLEANEKYQYAIVLFTRLTLDNQLVTGKLLAATKFYNFVQLPQNPVVISIAIGVTLGIFCVLLIILIGFIIYWKRLSNKDSPDIQIHSLR